MSQPFHDLPNARVLSESLVVSGQPDHGHLAQACEAGCSMVINLRPQEEHAEFDEANIVQELGMVYVHIPVQGPDDITVENARRLAQALVDCSAARWSPTVAAATGLAHCWPWPPIIWTSGRRSRLCSTVSMPA